MPNLPGPVDCIVLKNNPTTIITTLLLNRLVDPTVKSAWFGRYILPRRAVVVMYVCTEKSCIFCILCLLQSFVRIYFMVNGPYQLRFDLLIILIHFSMYPLKMR